MRVSVSKVFSGLLVVALVTPATLVRAAGADIRPAAANAPGIQASAQRAAQAIVLQASPTAAPAQPSIPRTLARTGKPSKQMSGGGGSMMMVMGLLGTAAGLAGTYYMVKTLRDQNKDQTTTPGLR